MSYRESIMLLTYLYCLSAFIRKKHTFRVKYIFLLFFWSIILQNKIFYILLQMKEVTLSQTTKQIFKYNI